MAIDFTALSDTAGVTGDPSTLPASGVPPLGVPAIPPLPQQPHNALPVAPQVAAAFAPPAAPAAPVVVPVPEQTITATVPATVPAKPAPVAAQPTTPPAQPTDALQASSGAVTEAEKKHAEATAATADQDQANAEAEAAAKEQQARDLKTQQALQAMDRQEAETRVQQTRDRAAAKKFTGLFEGEGGTARLIMSGIGQILGSLSFDSNHVNQVTKQIDDAMRLHFQRQEAEKADLWRDVQSAMDQKQALRADQLQEMGDFRATQAASLDAVIAKGKSLSALSKNKEGVAAIEANNARLGFERDKAIDEAKRLYQAMAEKRRLDTSEIAKNYAQASHSKALATGAASAVTDLKTDKLMTGIFAADEKNAIGSEKSPGPVKRYIKAKAMLHDIEESFASKDPDRIKAAMAAAREQTSNILTGAVATNMSTHLVTEMQSKLDVAISKISTLIGSPTEGAHFVGSMQKLIKGVMKQNQEQAGEFEQIATKKFKSTNAYKNKDLRPQGEARIDALFGAVKDGEVGPKWIAVPARLASNPKLAGKKEIQIDDSGNVIGAR